MDWEAAILKLIVMTITYKTLIILALSLSLLSCQQDKSIHSVTDIPRLMERTAALHYGQEWTNLQNSFAELSARASRDIDDLTSRISLAQIYIREARITGEHGHYYPAALDVLDQILDNEGRDKDQEFMAQSLKAGVLLSLHQFPEALETASAAVKLNPFNAQIYGVLVDAQVEMGDYRTAIEMADKMVSIRPDLRSYARVSYLREIHGMPEESIEAMEMAVAAGFPSYEETAWAKVTLSKLYRDIGDANRAEAILESILIERPNYPFAIAEQANLAFERGDPELAIDLLDQAIRVIPEVGFNVKLAEIYDHMGLHEEKAEVIVDVLAMLEDDEANGHKMSMEFAYVYGHLSGNNKRALEYLMEEYEIRPGNIDVNRMLAEIYVNLENWERARYHWERASQTGSGHPELKAIQERLAKVEGQNSQVGSEAGSI